MFARFSRGFRCYSTGGGDGSSFLTDLMKRIDNINTKTQSINAKKAQTLSQPKSQKAKVSGAKSGQKTAGQKVAGQKNAGQKNAGQRSDGQRKSVTQRKDGQAKPAKAPVVPSFASKPQISIKVKDHPFSNNAFKLMDESNFRPQRTGPRNTQNRNQGRTQNADARGKPARNAGRGKAPRNNSRDSRTLSRRVASGKQSIVAKKLETKLLKPTLNGDLFFYGKPATGGITSAARVATVAKGALLKSKYPYKLPKSIIDNMDPEFSGNRFLLQKDYSLEVDSAELADRMKKVVKGQVDDISVGTKLNEAEKNTHRELMRSGSLATEQKQVIFDVVSGKKKAQDLLQNAAWNQ